MELSSLKLDYFDVTVNRTFPAVSGDTITINVVRPNYTPGAQDVLLIHGYPHAWPIWKNQLGDPLMSSKYNLYAMDFRGMGQSQVVNPVPEDQVWNATTMGSDIYEVITQLGLVTPVIAFHSLSGTFVADFLRIYGDSGAGGVGGDTVEKVVGGPKLRGLISVDSFTAVDGIFLTDATLAILNSGDLFTADMGALLPGTEAFGAISTFCNLADPEKLELAMCDVTNTAESRTFSLFIPTPADLNVPVWESVSVPLLVVYGLKDAVILPNTAETFLELVPHSTFDPIKCCGHIPQYEKAKRLNGDISTFIDALPVVVPLPQTPSVIKAQKKEKKQFVAKLSRK